MDDRPYTSHNPVKAANQTGVTGGSDASLNYYRCASHGARAHPVSHLGVRG